MEATPAGRCALSPNDELDRLLRTARRITAMARTTREGALAECVIRALDRLADEQARAREKALDAVLDAWPSS